MQVKQCVAELNECDKQLRIAFIGNVGNGKSSTQNTIAAYACHPPRVKQVAHACCGGEVIKYFTEHPLEVWNPSSGKNEKSNIIMVDTVGKICKVRAHDGSMRTFLGTFLTHGNASTERCHCHCHCLAFAHVLITPIRKMWPALCLSGNS